MTFLVRIDDPASRPGCEVVGDALRNGGPSEGAPGGGVEPRLRVEAETAPGSSPKKRISRREGRH